MPRGKRVFLVGLVALATVPVVYLLTRPSTGEPLTPERLAAARALWKEKGPGSYVVDVDVRDAHHRVEVRDGKVVSMTTDGREAPERVRAYWTVEGMFQSLSEELSNLRRPEAAFGVSDPSRVMLRALFDEQYGYPARFLRHVEGETRSVEWQARLAER
ncbi:MAG: DUF6174 domain-containing protein [Planctomycetes bacterium]|nr:DUF6174 domain-containing protein [Planctomycetota bacterium]